MPGRAEQGRAGRRRGFGGFVSCAAGAVVRYVCKYFHVSM